MYAVWNVETGNLLGQYASEQDALDAVGRLIVANGIDYGGELALARNDARGLPESIDAGLNLLRRAFAVTPQAASYLAGSYQAFVAPAGVGEQAMTWERTTGLTLGTGVSLKFGQFGDLIYSGQHEIRWSTSAPVARSRPAEENKQPALALAA